MFLAYNEKALNGYQFVNGHMVFDIMTDFSRRACLMVGGPVNHPLEVIVYSSLVTKKAVSASITKAVLHGIQVKAMDVLNAYVIRKA